MDTEDKRPFIQIDDLVREMTDEEISNHKAFLAGLESLPDAE